MANGDGSAWDVFWNVLKMIVLPWAIWASISIYNIQAAQILGRERLQTMELRMTERLAAIQDDMNELKADITTLHPRKGGADGP